MHHNCRKETKHISLLGFLRNKIVGSLAVTVQDQTGWSYYAHKTSVDTSIKVDKFTHDFICRAVSTSLRLICAEALGKYPDRRSWTREMGAKEASVQVYCHSITGTPSGNMEHCRSRSHWRSAGNGQCPWCHVIPEQVWPPHERFCLCQVHSDAPSSCVIHQACCCKHSKDYSFIWDTWSVAKWLVRRCCSKGKKNDAKQFVSIFSRNYSVLFRMRQAACIMTLP